MDTSFPSENNELIRQYDIESNARTYSRFVINKITSGAGTTLSDEEGNVYIDCLAGAGTLALGHNHPAVITELKQFLDSGQILHGLDFITPVKRKFSEMIISLFPAKWRDELKMHYCGPSGADATEAAMKLFKTATHRSSVIAFHGAYHGMTNGSMSLTGNLAIKGAISNLMPEVHFFPYPYLYRNPYGKNADELITISLHHIYSALTDPNSGIKKPAAMIVEAIQGEGGCIPAPASWLNGLARICEELEIPLVLDEIQCGIGRSGDMFAFEESGIKPDAILLSKAVGGGLPMSLVVYNRKYDCWKPGAHTGTFRGNQMAMAAGYVTLEIIKQKNFLDDVRENGRFFKHLLNELKLKYPQIGDVRGRGLMLGLEMIDPQKKNPLGQPFGDGVLANKIKQKCYEMGLIVETGGRNDAVIRFLPPLIIDKTLISQVVAILDTALKSETDPS